jgi:4-coumarate--CoA ligase
MAPAIYTSPIPSIPIVARSVFTHLFALSPNEPHLIGGYPGSAPAFIDSDTGTTLTRAQTRSFALQLGFGLRHDQRTAASTQRGDVVLIFSPNLLSWPVVLFGSGEYRQALG